jgi:hypothetical protein
MSEQMTFEDSLDEDDWGLIIGSDGSLKGLFIPEGHDDDEVPEAIIEICTKFFGVDPTEEVTLH